MERLNVNVNEPTAEKLRRVAAAREMNITDTVRFCVSVTDYLVGEMAAGQTLALIGPDGTVREISLVG